MLASAWHIQLNNLLAPLSSVKMCNSWFKKLHVETSLVTAFSYSQKSHSGPISLHYDRVSIKIFFWSQTCVLISHFTQLKAPRSWFLNISNTFRGTDSLVRRIVRQDMSRNVLSSPCLLVLGSLPLISHRRSGWGFFHCSVVRVGNMGVLPHLALEKKTAKQSKAKENTQTSARLLNAELEFIS